MLINLQTSTKYLKKITKAFGKQNNKNIQKVR